MSQTPINPQVTYGTNLQGHFVHFTWQRQSQGYYNYAIWRNSSNIANVSSANSFDDYNILPGVTYQYQVAEDDRYYMTYPTSVSLWSAPATITIPDPTVLAAPTGITVVSQRVLSTTDNRPVVYIRWINVATIDTYKIYRNGALIATVNAVQDAAITTNGYSDFDIDLTHTYNYSVVATKNGISSPGSTVVTAGAIPGLADAPATGVPPIGAPVLYDGVRKWVFEDVYKKGPMPYLYTMHINPNDGGSPTFEKQINALKVTGPNQFPLIQEGSPGLSTMAFSGILLDQQQYEAMEIWFRKRILMLITDDLGRRFYGVFSGWTPKRSRRASNPWYHTYDAQMSLIAYYNASGEHIYGRMLDAGEARSILKPILRRA